MGNAKAYLSISLVNVLWGLSFIASKRALASGFQTFSLAFVRFLVAAVILVPILIVREGSLKMPKGSFLRLLASSLLGMTGYFFFEYSGLKRTSASTASLIIAAVPALTLIYGVLFKKQKYQKVCYLGVILSLVGVFFIVRYGAAGGGDTLAGDLLIVGACLCWIGYMEVTDGLMKAHSSLTVTTWQSVLAAATLLPCAMTEDVAWGAVSPLGWAMALYLAVFCSVLGYLLHTESIRVLEPFKTALFINLNPLAAVLGGVLLLGERLAPMQLVGGAIVLASIFLVNRNAAPQRPNFRNDRPA